MAAAATTLGTRIDVVALCAGQIALPADALDKGRALVAGLEVAPRWDARGHRGGLRDVEVGWPSGVAVTGRHGLTVADVGALGGAAGEAAERVAAILWPGSDLPAGRVLVLGTEELMYAPMRIATALADLVDAVPGASSAGLVLHDDPVARPRRGRPRLRRADPAGLPRPRQSRATDRATGTRTTSPGRAGPGASTPSSSWWTRRPTPRRCALPAACWTGCAP